MRTLRILAAALAAAMLFVTPTRAATVESCNAPHVGCLAACGNCAALVGFGSLGSCPAVYKGLPGPCKQACETSYTACKAQYVRQPFNHLFEANTDRKGSDYFSTTLGQTQTPADCRAMCLAEGSCRAWTFVKAGIQHPTNPRCWLKNEVRPAVASGCCTSGLKNPK